MAQTNTITHDGQTFFQLPTFPAYYVGRNGTFYSTLSKTILCPPPNSRGYCVLHLQKSGWTHTVSAHRIVCEFFHGPPPANRPFACHRNDVGDDNRAVNLYWANQTQNLEDAARNSRMKYGSRHARAKLTETQVLEIRRRLTAGATQGQCAKMFGIHKGVVSRIHLRKAWRHI